jgi:molybdate/tungstate transport system permease protein
MPPRFRAGAAALWLLAALLVLFIAGPLLRLALEARPGGLSAAFRDRELLAALWLTALTATSATILSVGLGVPLAWLLARAAFPGRRLIAGLVELPVVVPHPVAGIALLLFLGRQSAVGGALARAGLEFVSHVPGIVAGMLFVSAPIVVSAAREAFRAVDPRYERVARTLGDTGWLAFRRVTLPLAGRSILAGGVLGWARSVSEFGSIVILTYHPQVASVLIYDRFTLFGLDAAVPAAVLLLILALGLFLLVQLLAPGGEVRR